MIKPDFATPDDGMTDSAANYLAALAALRLRALITAARWAEPEDTFDLVLAAALARGAA